MRKLSSAEIKATELDILKAFEAYCEQHGVEFYLAFGTLIGAVRHKGFIPWDDDIDVLMKREDYMKINELLKTEKVRDDLEWTSIENNDSDLPFGKLSSTTHRAETYGEGNDQGLWIDVFPLDNYTRSAVKKALIWKKILVAKGAIKWDLKPRNIVRNIIHCMFFMVSKRFIAKKISDIARSVKPNGNVANMVWNTYAVNPFPASMFDETAYYDFEDTKFKSVKDYDAFLSNIYGDYMKLPPEDQRISHEMNAYCITED